MSDWEIYNPKNNKNNTEWDVYNPESIQQPQQPQQSFLEKLPLNIGAGLAEGGRGILNIPNTLKNLTGGRLFSHAEHFEPANFGKIFGIRGEPTLADEAIQGISEFAPALFAPEAQLGKVGSAIENIPKYGKFLKKYIANALYPSAYAATQSEEHPLKEAAYSAGAALPFAAISQGIASGNPALRALSRAGLSAAGGLLGYESAKALGLPESAQYTAGAAGGLLGLTGKNQALAAKRRIAESVEGTNYPEKLAATQRLGLKYLTPAEASGNAFLGAEQGAIGKTAEGAKQFIEKGQERIGTEKKAINTLFETIHKEETNPEISNLYKQSYKKTIPEEQLNALNDNEIFKKAKKTVISEPIYKENLKNVPENSIAYLDQVKKSIDDMISKADKVGEKNKVRLLKETRDDLISKMDSIAPEYKKARGLAERKITREKIESALNEDEIKGTDFFRRILKNDKKYNKLQHSLRNVPEAQQTLQDMRLVFKDLINPPSVRSAAGFTKAGMNQERNSKKAWSEAFKQILSNGKHDKTIVDLLTNPNWQKEIQSAKNLTSWEERAKKMFDVFGKAAGASASYESKETK